MSEESPGGSYFIVARGPERGRTIRLGRGTVRIGRSSENELVLADPTVSRFHARLECGPDGTRIAAAGDAPVSLDGRPVTDAALAPGAVIQLGDTTLVFDEQTPGEALPGVVHVEVARPLGSATYAGPGVAGGERATRDREVVYRAALAMSRAASDAELRAAVVEHAEAGVAGGRVILFLAGGDGERLVPAAMSDDAIDGAGAATYSRTVLKAALSQSRALLCANVVEDPRFQRSESARALRLRSVAVAPIVARERLLGALYVDSGTAARPLGPEDLDLLAALANIASVALVNLDARQTLQRSQRALSHRLRDAAEITGQSGPMARVLTMLGKLAQTRATVLIRGESGTGKELAAAYLHYHSDRAERPFVAINCAALNRDLIESELFGHLKGAFTGATTRREGRFQEAHSGTLFLDEIGEMDLACQAKLLRVLETREVTPLGGNLAVPVDVRILAGTNRDLEGAIEAGAFRKDLFYRLRVAEVVLPRLAERKGDLPLLVQRFIAAGNQELGKRVRGVTPEALAILEGHAWPGNVRELKNALQMAMILAEGEELEATDLPDYLLAAPRTETPAAGGTLADAEKAHILAVLEEVGGNRAQAARVLRISKRTLYAKLALFAREA